MLGIDNQDFAFFLTEQIFSAGFEENYFFNVENKQNLDYLFPTFTQFGTSVG